MGLVQAALEPTPEITALQSKGGIGTSHTLIERHKYIVLIHGRDFCIVWFQTIFLTRRDINCKKTKVNLRNGIAFAVVVVVVTVAVVNTFTEYFRNGLCCWGFLDVFNACNKLSPETHIKIIGSSPEEKDHPTPQWKAEGIILVMYF